MCQTYRRSALVRLPVHRPARRNSTIRAEEEVRCSRRTGKLHGLEWKTVPANQSIDRSNEILTIVRPRQSINQSINQSIGRRTLELNVEIHLPDVREYDNIRPYQCCGDIARGVYDGRRLFAIIPHHGDVSSLGLSGDQGKLGEIHVEFLPPPFGTVQTCDSTRQIQTDSNYP